MDANERPISIKILFDAFYDAMKEENYSQAQAILNDLENCMGEYDPDLTACRMKLELAQL